MPKKLKIHPNERVDLVDFNRAANEYTVETSNFGNERVVLDRRSRVLEGFRVEIANQTTNPGQLTIYNGNALDRTGRHLNDEDQVNDARTITLTGVNLSFYLEVEFIESASDSDSRSFWDPTYDNGGAPTPDGREFNLNVTTRTTPTWEIHTPVASGAIGGTPLFEELTNPNSTRIPIAVLSTNGANEITGATQVNAASVLEADIAAGVTSVRLVNSRLLPAAGTASLGFGSGSVEAVTITANDRANGILTLAAPTANTHSAGAIVRETGVIARFMQEQTDPTTAVAHPDAQSRLWQGNELRGAAVQSSKEVYLGRDDLNTRSLKDHVDLIAAQFRELKFGSTTPAVVSLAPPTAFPAAPRYFDRVGSVAGARNATVSIGDGTSSFGDFNGTDETPFAAAVAALPATGGSIHVKSGTYTFANQLSIAKPVQFTGEGAASTRLLNNVGAGTPMILVTGLTADQHLALEYLSLENTGVSFALFRQDGARTVLQSCNFLGNVDFSASAVTHFVSIDDCVFSNSESGGVALSSSDQLSGTISACEFRVGTAAGTEKCFSGSGDRLTFSGCNFISTGGSFVPVAVDFATSSSAVCFEGCNFAANTVIESVAAVLSGLSIMGCTFYSTGTPTAPAFNFGSVFNLHVHGLYGETSWSGTSSASPGAVFKFTVDNVYNCNFESVIVTVMTAAQYVRGWEFTNVARKRAVTIKDSYAQGMFIGVYASGGSGSIVLRNLTIDGNSSALTSQYGVRFVSEDQYNCVIDGLRIYNFDGVTGGALGIVSDHFVASRNIALKVVNCDLSELGSGASTTGYGVAVTATTGDLEHLDICQNSVDMGGTFSAVAHGISVDLATGTSSQHVHVSGNSVSHVVGTTEAAGIYCNIGSTGKQAIVSENSVHDVRCAGVGAGNFGSGIHIAGGDGYVVQGNVIADVGNLATGTSTVSSGIFAGGATFAGNTVISNNKVNLTRVVVPGVVDSGIQLQPTVASSTNYSVVDNEVVLGADCLRGISIISQAGATGLTSITVDGNNITGLERASGLGIDISVLSGTRNICVSNNNVAESTFEAAHTAISVASNGVPATTPSAVAVSGNTVTGDLSGAALRTGFGLYLYYMNQFSVTGNSLAWVGGAPATATGTTIEIGAGSQSGVVSSNVVNVSGGVADIDLAAVLVSYPGPAPAIACIGVEGNVGFSTTGTGTIAPAASPYASWIITGNANF